MGLLNKTSKIDTIVPKVTSYGWYGGFTDDVKIVKNMEAFNEWRFNMGQLLGDEFPMKEWLKKFSAVKNYLKDNTIVKYKPDDGYFSAHIYEQEGDLLIEHLYVDCKTNPALDKKIIEDIIKSMTL